MRINWAQPNENEGCFSTGKNYRFLREMPEAVCLDFRSPSTVTLISGPLSLCVFSLTLKKYGSTLMLPPCAFQTIFLSTLETGTALHKNKTECEASRGAIHTLSIMHIHILQAITEKKQSLTRG